LSSRRPIAPRRINIDQLDLDLRGLPHAVAQSVAQRVGPALTLALRAALAQRRAGSALAREPAGKVQARPTSDPHALVTGIAQRVAARIVSGAD
jgi:hypothetical protein